MACNPLSEITPASKQWNICARVSRLWEYRGGVDHGSIQHLDLVLVDAHGNAIYGEVPGEHVETTKDRLQEGHVYTFSRFLVCPNKEKYRAVDTKYMIELTYHTKIQELHDIPPDFPSYAYKLVSFSDLPAYVGETRSFIDVIGAVVGVSNTAAIQGANQPTATIRRVVILQDASNHQVKLTIWGRRASEFDGDQIYESGQSQPVVVLFVGVLMKRYGHEEGLTGNTACRWYICPHIPEASLIRSSLQSQFQSTYRIDLQEHIPASGAITTNIPEKTLQEIIDINPFDFPSSGLICTVTISRLSPGQTWFFFSCNKCNRKSVPDGGSYKCSSCLCRAAKPRYKLCVIATDGTAEAEFILFGDVGQRVVGKQVGAILRSNRGSDQIPADIAQVVCTKFTWHFTITERSFHGANKTYQVNRIIAALGRQASIPIISSPISTASCSAEAASSSADISAIPLSHQITAYTPPSPQHLPITDKTEHLSSQDEHTHLVSTRKRLFEPYDVPDKSTQQEQDRCYTNEPSSPKPSEKKQRTMSGVDSSGGIAISDSSKKDDSTFKKTS